jgi:putative hydrolase of the HAD superfamily
MSLRAVVFDLYGTLVTYPPGAQHVRAMAARLGIPYEALRPAWRALRPQRDGGELDTLGSLRACCDALGLTPAEEELALACAEVAEFFRAVLTPRDGAISTISELRALGLRIGVLSDANIETSHLWPGTAFAPLVDCAVFSSVQHVRKPDPSLYRVVCERLDVAAEDCLYVGNGDGDELAGAMRAGMRAVLFTAPGELPGKEAADWRGDRIAVLADVVRLTAAAGRPA